jgi:hypothetical protein
MSFAGRRRSSRLSPYRIFDFLLARPLAALAHEVVIQAPTKTQSMLALDTTTKLAGPAFIILCGSMIFVIPAEASEFGCGDPKVIERLEVSLTCGTTCIPGLTNEEVKARSQAELSRHAEEFFVRNGGRQWWVGGILNYVAAVLPKACGRAHKCQEDFGTSSQLRSETSPLRM